MDILPNVGGSLTHLPYILVCNVGGISIVKENKISVPVDGLWRLSYDPTVEGPLLSVMFPVETNTPGAHFQTLFRSLSISEVSWCQNLTLDASLPPALTLEPELVLKLPSPLSPWQNCFHASLTPNLQDVLSHSECHLTLLQKSLVCASM